MRFSFSTEKWRRAKQKTTCYAGGVPNCYTKIK